jgi:hypothetical protein
MGEGYRIIAATASIRADEKAEITSKSPSHGSLYGQEDAIGLASFALKSGRRCVAYICHAGQEHTARGGWRVYSHATVLTQEQWQALHSNPVSIHAQLAAHVDQQGHVLKPVPSLDSLTLSLDTPTLSSSLDLPTEPAAQTWVWKLADTAMQDQQLILTQANDPIRLLHGTLRCLPRSLRNDCDVYVNLKFSPSRLGLIQIISENDPQLVRLTMGRPIELYQHDQIPAAAEPCASNWIQLLASLPVQSAKSLLSLTDELSLNETPETLEVVSTYCQQLFASKDANGPDSDSVRPPSALDETQAQKLRSWAQSNSATTPIPASAG